MGEFPRGGNSVGEIEEKQKLIRIIGVARISTRERVDVCVQGQGSEKKESHS